MKNYFEFNSCKPCAPDAPLPPAELPTFSDCQNLYRETNFQYTLGKAQDPIPIVGAKPAINTPVLDGAYGTCIRRLTNNSVQPPAGFARHYYSRRQAWNADDTLMHIVALDGTTHLYDAIDFTYFKEIPIRMDSEFIWSDTNPNIAYHMDQYGGDKIYQRNVVTDEVITIADFSSRWPYPGVTKGWTRGEGSPSENQRYWCMQLEDDNQNFFGVMIYDRLSDSIIASKTGAELLNTSRPDHCSMSVSGNYCVISWLDQVVAFDQNLENRDVLQDKSSHSDLCRLSNGDDMYVSVDYNSNEGDIFAINLNTGAKTVYFPIYIEGTSRALHFSGRGYEKKNWVVISAYANSGADKWIDEKIILLNLIDGTIVNLAFHQSIFNGYWTEPQATPNKSLTKIVYASNWNTDTQTNMDSYIITLPIIPLLNRLDLASTLYLLPRPSLRGV